MTEEEQQPPNALAKIQLRVSDLPVLLDALESRLAELGEGECCSDPDCASCASEHAALERMRTTLLNGAPRVEVGR